MLYRRMNECSPWAIANFPGVLFISALHRVAKPFITAPTFDGIDQPNTSSMRRNLLCILGCGLFIIAAQGQYVIPDPVFASFLNGEVPNAVTGNVLDTNHVEVTSLTELSVTNPLTTDLSGVQFFDALERLHCNGLQLTSLPPLPATLELLGCDDNELTNLPTLPASLTYLSCVNNALTSLPDLPPFLFTILCNNNQLSTLPLLPAALRRLECQDNQLTSLPPLPAGLETLYCNNNLLTSIPALPPSLTALFCFDNQLSSLPELPASLLTLICTQNVLTSLPALPASMTFLWCGDNQLSSLPPLPPMLDWLMCSNNQLTCLPVLPASLDKLQCQGNAISCLPNFPFELPPFGTGLFDSNLGFDPVLCSTSDPCFPSEVISGVMFNDVNGNGLWDPAEGPFHAGVAEAQPGDYLSGVDVQGNYALPVAPGAYTVQGQAILYHMITTPVHEVTITPGMSDTANHIGFQLMAGVHDLVVDIQSGVTRPGFDNNVWLEVRNIGTEPTTASIDLDLDADQTFVASSISPTSQAGTSVNWSVLMNPGDVWNATVILNTPQSVPLGTAIDHLFAAIPASSDTTPEDNSAAWNDVVVGSYDPNDKTASDSTLTPTQVINGEWIEYLIRFQNTGTFMAEHVRITDTLSTDLQWGTFKYISSSHDNYWFLANGTLVFQYDNIQLPDSNSNEPESHGFVKFRIKPNPDLVVGDQLVNVANIYFDFNEPVITAPSVVLIDASTGAWEHGAYDVRIHPIPTNGELNIVSEQVIENLQLFSSDGRLLRSVSVNSASHRMDVNALQPGMYLLELNMATGSKSQRVVIEN